MTLHSQISTAPKVSEFISPIAGLKYFVCMIDYGGKIGMGADVAPEYSRRDIVEMVRNKIMRGMSIVHVKQIEGNDMFDVTDEILRDALDEHYNPGLITVQDLIDERNSISPADRQAAAFDHAQDHRKHAAVE